jgi:hypothetical protein
MKKLAWIAALLVAVVVGAVVVYQLRVREEAAKWSGPLREILEESIEHEGNATRSRFVAMLPAPVERVEAVVWQVERFQEVVPNFKVSRLIEEQGDKKRVELGIQALNLPLLRYEMEFTRYPQEHRVTFRTLKSQAQEIEGEYRLEASPDGTKTRVTYISTAREKVPLPFPRAVLDSAGREVFANTVRGMEKLLQGAAPPA